MINKMYKLYRSIRSVFQIRSIDLSDRLKVLDKLYPPEHPNYSFRWGMDVPTLMRLDAMNNRDQFNALNRHIEATDRFNLSVNNILQNWVQSRTKNKPHISKYLVKRSKTWPGHDANRLRK